MENMSPYSSTFAEPLVAVSSPELHSEGSGGDGHAIAETNGELIPAAEDVLASMMPGLPHDGDAEDGAALSLEAARRRAEKRKKKEELKPNTLSSDYPQRAGLLPPLHDLTARCRIEPRAFRGKGSSESASPSRERANEADEAGEHFDLPKLSVRLLKVSADAVSNVLVQLTSQLLGAPCATHLTNTRSLLQTVS